MIYLIVFISLINAKTANKGLKLSKTWFQGRHLVYDCRYDHFACVGERSFDRCVGYLDEDLSDGKTTVRCTPIKTFADEGECIREQYSIIQKVREMPFCANHLNKRTFTEVD